jgi:hypothetical protein
VISSAHSSRVRSHSGVGWGGVWGLGFGVGGWGVGVRAPLLCISPLLFLKKRPMWVRGHTVCARSPRGPGPVFFWRCLAGSSSSQ